jgi:hypothetical protein
MGCCASRKETELKIEETVLTPFETSLGLSKIPHSTISEACKSLSEKGYISYLELSKLYSEQGLVFQEIFEFYDQFDRSRSRIVTQKRFSYLQLQSLFLLLCKGESKSKLSFWFKLYDDGKKMITTTRVDEMLENLIKVTVDFICNYLAKKHPENGILAKYEKFVKAGSEMLQDELSKKIRNNRPIVTEDEFLLNCLKAFRNDLFSPMALRDRSYYFGINGATSIKNELEDPCNKKPPPLSFEDLSDASFIFEKKQKSAKHSRSNSSISFFSAEDKNQKENLRYSKDSNRKFSILQPANDGDHQEPNTPRRRSRREKDFVEPNLLPPSGGKSGLRRSSHNFNPAMLGVDHLNQNTGGKFAKRFSIIVTSHEI